MGINEKNAGEIVSQKILGPPVKLSAVKSPLFLWFSQVILHAIGVYGLPRLITANMR